MKGVTSPSNTFFNEHSGTAAGKGAQEMRKLVLPSLQGGSSSNVGSAAQQSRLHHANSQIVQNQPQYTATSTAYNNAFVNYQAQPHSSRSHLHSQVSPHQHYAHLDHSELPLISMATTQVSMIH